MSSTTHEVRASQTASPVLVQAIEPVPGLFVYEQPEELRRPLDDWYPWRLGHHSGLIVAVAMYEDDAIRGAQKIADRADWTQDVEDLRTAIDADGLYQDLSWSSCEHPTLARLI
jgi:hypothetical protein